MVQQESTLLAGLMFAMNNVGRISILNNPFDGRHREKGNQVLQWFTGIEPVGGNHCYILGINHTVKVQVALLVVSCVQPVLG